MSKKIFKICSFLITSLFITSSIFFTSINSLEAVQMSSDNAEENALGIIIEETTDSSKEAKTIDVPDLGDDQAFPFIPGFGKNSGKDWYLYLNYLLVTLLLNLLRIKRLINSDKFNLVSLWTTGNLKL